MPPLYFSLTYEPWTVSSLISSECITCFNVCFITLSFRGSFNTKEERHTRFRALEPVILKRQVSRINLALAEAEKKRDKLEKHHFWEVSSLWFISAGEGVLLLPQECGFWGGSISDVWREIHFSATSEKPQCFFVSRYESHSLLKHT